LMSSMGVLGMAELAWGGGIMRDAGCGVECGIRNFDPMQGAEEECGMPEINPVS